MKNLFTFMLLSSIAFSSCVESDFSVVENPVSDLKTENEREEISKIIDFIFPSRHPSRANSAYSINTLYSNDGTPAIHVINFDNDEGFLLVSASKKHYPILAHSEKGHFCLTDLNKPGNVSFWQKEMIESIADADRIMEETDFAWLPFLIKEASADSENARTLSRTNSEYPEINELIADSLASWNRKGYQILTIDEYEPRDATEEYLINDLRNNMYPMDVDNWKDYVFVVKFTKERSITIPDLMKSCWDQDNGFNIQHPLVNNQHCLAGCSPVAAGQIMRYHQKPISLNWSNMPLTYATPTTSQFLYELGVRAKTNFAIDGSSTNYKNMKKALESYGYKCKDGNYSHATVLSSIEKKRPVYVRAEEEVSKKGHAWVISGVKTIESSDATIIYRPVYSTYMAPAIEHYDNYGYIYTHYCNWGYGGEYDGFYAMDRYNPGIYNYSNDKHIIYDIYY